jgi:hypothetical protein
MAENSFSRMPRPTAPGVTVNRTGDGWGVGASHAEAYDRTTHLPFATPGTNPPPAYVPPAPPPSEASLRAALVAAIEQQKAADERLHAATEAHGRALKLIEDRKQALAAFSGLDDDRMLATLNSLRDDDGGATLPRSDDRLIRREVAKLDVDDAERAAETLLHELVLFRQQADAAAQEVNRLIVSVLSHTADRIADEYNDLLRQEAARKEVLHAFDQFSANSGARLSGKVSSILMAGGTAGLTKMRDTSEWQAARAALLKDPQAEITIDTPAPPAPQAAWQPIIPRPAIPAAEYFRRLREADVPQACEAVARSGQGEAVSGGTD